LTITTEAATTARSVTSGTLDRMRSILSSMTCGRVEWCSRKNHSRSKEIETLFLGEYCDSLSKVKVLDMTDGVVVWEDVADPDFAFCRFTLSRGENPAIVRGISKATIPANQNTFTLRSGRRYEVTVWGLEARAGCGASSQRFEF
jgi:hypothetical protein